MMTFPIFLIACLNAFIFWQLLDYFKPQIKAVGLRWTYHLQAFFEIHFWQVEDIKRRDKIKNKVTVVDQVDRLNAPRCWRWEVKTHNVENKEYETIEVDLIEPPK